MPDYRMSDSLILDHTYEMWHRPASLKRFMNEGIARALADLNLDNPPVDNIFVCVVCWNPVAIAEDTTVSLDGKVTTVTYNLAYRTCSKCGSTLFDIPAYVIRFWPSDTPNPTAPEFPDIDRFEVRHLIELPGESPMFHTPAEHAVWLVTLHAAHLSNDCPNMKPGYYDRFTHELYEKATSKLRAALGR